MKRICGYICSPTIDRNISAYKSLFAFVLVVILTSLSKARKDKLLQCKSKLPLQKVQQLPA